VSPGSLHSDSPQSLIRPGFEGSIASRSASYHASGFVAYGYDRSPDSIVTGTPIQLSREVPCWQSISQTFARCQHSHSHLSTYRPARLTPYCRASRIPTAIGDLCAGELVEGEEGFPGALLSILRVPHPVSSFRPEHCLAHPRSHHGCSLPHTATLHGELPIVLSRKPGLKSFKSQLRNPSFSNGNSRLLRRFPYFSYRSPRRRKISKREYLASSPGQVSIVVDRSAASTRRFKSVHSSCLDLPRRLGRYAIPPCILSQSRLRSCCDVFTTSESVLLAPHDC